MLEVYYNENSICSERVLMTLAEKGIEDWVPRPVKLIAGEQFNPDYLKLNPKAQVPTLVHDGAIVRESSLICDYLDELYPEPPLKPGALRDIARLREWVKESDEAGYQGVAALSFTAVFRARLLGLGTEALEARWAAQTDLGRTQRQRSCVELGLESPHALLALVAWESIFAKMEKALADGRPWLMGDQFGLADLNLIPFVARLDALTLLPVWLARRPHARAWWRSAMARPSYAGANVGPAAGEERATHAREGEKIAGRAAEMLGEYLARRS